MKKPIKRIYAVPVELLSTSEDVEHAINYKGYSSKAILFYDGSFDLESTFDGMKQNFSMIDFYKVNGKVNPELHVKFGNSKKIPFVNFYQSYGIDGAKPTICGVAESEKCLSSTVENIHAMIDKLSGNLKQIK